VQQLCDTKTLMKAALFKTDDIALKIGKYNSVGDLRRFDAWNVGW
jgi:hypothetical protein